jgi:hypothetical protein
MCYVSVLSALQYTDQGESRAVSNCAIFGGKIPGVDSSLLMVLYRQIHINIIIIVIVVIREKLITYFYF